MDKVKLLPKHLKDFKLTNETEGYYNSSGNWIDGIKTEINFKAVPFPLGEGKLVLQLLREGAINQDSIKIYTKQDLGTELIDANITRISDNKIYRVYNGKPFEEMADLKIYLLNRIEGES